ncbi:hypothetical protein PG997_002617 [Apiospora hydei]|uniref:Uncharacterized protein n=1 Tax=Apiospora hydei TaxID=1337664 RepID=A0ABR1WWW9_9PEZI
MSLPGGEKAEADDQHVQYDVEGSGAEDNVEGDEVVEGQRVRGHPSASGMAAIEITTVGRKSFTSLGSKKLAVGDRKMKDHSKGRDRGEENSAFN